MSDETRQCVDCGRKFIWSYGEQRYYHERGLTPPKRCPACRSRRRTEGAARPPRPARPPVPAARQPRLQTRGIGAVPGFLLLTFGLAAVLAAVLWGLVPLDPLLSWLIAVNLVTLGAYGYDKTIADTRWTRVPERVLLALTLFGGTPCALLAMPLFHHKTIKAEFRVKFWLVVAGQVVLVALYLLVIRLWLAG
jgi:uncharacterized membrane protein YsdA (DUF1294 family)/DNA-directed RNA polymerase subunit RPC12/RpoP